MFESFVIMLREGIEAALIIGILLVVLKRTGKRNLERPIYAGLGLAVIGSVGMAFALNALPIEEEAYEGFLYWTSALFVISMMVWMHFRAKDLRADIEQRVRNAGERVGSAREAWGLGAFAFIMLFREGAETVLFLSAVSLTTDALLSFIGTLAGLTLAVAFCVMFVRGSLKVDLRRFFTVTTWVLAIFVVQLIVNGYHEFSEAGIVPATQQTMAMLGPVVRNNSLFLLAIVAIPLFVWITRVRPDTAEEVEADTPAARRLASARRGRERLHRLGAVFSTLLVLGTVGFSYVTEALPKFVPPPESALRVGDDLIIPLADLEDGNLHRFGFLSGGRMVRFLAMKSADGEYRSSLDACEICGTFGYIQDGPNLLCLNCAAEINPLTLGNPGGCNPIPLASRVEGERLLVAAADLEKSTDLFEEQSGSVEDCPVCGMQVKIKEASEFETYESVTYFFCDMGGCGEKFREDPAVYVR